MDDSLFAIYFCALLGLGFIIGSLLLYLYSNETLKWTPISAKIKEIKLYKFKVNKDEPGSYLYRIKVLYTYKYENVVYDSKRFFYGDFIGISFSDKIKKLAQSYGAGEEIIVFCNPDKPKGSVIKKGVQSIVYEILIIGVFLIVLSVLIFFIA
ncbi:DUF3592 domain-containing protein [Dysgonomonas sp. Marseille-P4361]|uniref:DUF3592 domain-containing protein n=1 Tax=Dysgonomonas sp. Marseille-P4361 TaxID=2161820 RepID=UPI000D551D27|nr:DUF3592 domain-containing protein [Dysgonomonas sp. Marseille-P4361]